MTKIYVVTTKKEKMMLPSNYEYIQVNAANNSKIYPLTDDTFDNISLKNPNYCELTALYWIWKNDNVNQIVGLMHYRRFLTLNKFSTKTRFFLNEKVINKQLKKHNFIATKLYKTNVSIKDHLLLNVREKDFNSLRQIIHVKYPEYLDTFDYVFKNNKTYLLNIFISNKNELNSYATWLFDILFELEKNVSMEGYSTQEKRLYGFLSERLFTVYVLKNKLKVKSYSTCIIGEKLTKIIKNKVMKILHIKKY